MTRAIVSKAGLFAVLALLLIAPLAVAQESSPIPWPPPIPNDPAMQTYVKVIRMRAGLGDQAGRDVDVLRIENTQSKPLTFTLFRLDKPGIVDTHFSLNGWIRYDNVEGFGYLEMWIHYVDGSAFFTRTQNLHGPMSTINSSGARRFSLPFDAASRADHPVAVEFNLILPGKGVVDIYPMSLSQWGGPLLSAAVSQPGAIQVDYSMSWRVVLLGALGLLLIGLPLLIVLIVLLALGKTRGAMTILLILGIGPVLVGMGLLILRQMLVIGLPALVIGAFMITIASIMLRRLNTALRPLNSQPADQELRKIQAMDSR